MHSGQELFDSYIVGPILALMGGVVTYIQRLRKSHKVSFSLAELVGECTIAGFVGVLTMLMCAAYAVGPELSAALTGIAGHMGSRALFLIEQAVSRRIGVKLGDGG